MWKLMIGPALLGGGYIAGSVYGRDSEQVVHKDPATVYAAVEQAIDGARQSGTMQLEGGAPVEYELRVDRTPEQQLLVHVLMNGVEGASGLFRLTPESGGKDTLVALKVHTDHSVLRSALAGTDKAKLAYAPDWMLNIAARPVLQKLAEQIEKGELVADPTQGFTSQAEWESQLPPDQQKEMQEWRQYDAARPMVDPNADANRFLNKSQ
jgi:hypothetical protein